MGYIMHVVSCNNDQFSYAKLWGVLLVAIGNEIYNAFFW